MLTDTIYVGSVAGTRPLQGIRPSSARTPSSALSFIDSADGRRLGDTKCQNYSNFRMSSSGRVRHATLVQQTPNAEHCNSAANENRFVLLRDDHVVLWAIDGLLTLHAAFVRWRSHRRTFRALADLDEEQLRDIGLTRDSPMLAKHKSYRALAELDDTQLCNLSERGLQARREARREGL